jgi:hypothetical protein
MKRLLLTTIAALTILFAQAQIAPCDSLIINGSQFQATISVNTGSLPSLIYYWVTTAPDGTVLAEDSMSTTHSIYAFNPATGLYCDTITTCLHTMNTICCVTYVWNGNAWTVPGGTPTPSWDCPTNTPGGCYDPGTGLGQYSSLAACQAVCGTPTPSWDCGLFGCSDPGTGMGQYTSLSSCQAVCVVGPAILCDSITASGSQYQMTLQLNNVNTFVDYWVTTANDGTILGEDSMSTTHNVFNYNPSTSLPYDTINVCITYTDANGLNTCCETWIWDANLGVWAKMGSVTSIGEINLFDKKLIKVVDVLGRETSINSNQTLFFIYEDGTIEKRYIIDTK